MKNIFFLIFIDYLIKLFHIYKLSIFLFICFKKQIKTNFIYKFTISDYKIKREFKKMIDNQI